MQEVECVSGDAKARILLGGYLVEIIFVVVPPAMARIGAIAQHRNSLKHYAKVSILARAPRRIVLEAPVLRAVARLATLGLEDASRQHASSIDGDAPRGILYHTNLLVIATRPIRFVVLEVEALARPSGAPCHLGPRPVARRRSRVRGADQIAVHGLQLLVGRVIVEPNLILVARARRELEAIAGLRHIAGNDDAQIGRLVRSPRAASVEQKVLPLGLGVASAEGDGPADSRTAVAGRQAKVSVLHEDDQPRHIVGVRNAEERCEQADQGE